MLGCEDEGVKVSGDSFLLSGASCDPLESSSVERRIGSGALHLWISIKKLSLAIVRAAIRGLTLQGPVLFSLPCHSGCGLRGVTVTDESSRNCPCEESWRPTHRSSLF